MVRSPNELDVVAVDTTWGELQPLKCAPDVPTVGETLPGYEAVNWAGFAAPVGVPREIAQRLADDITAVLAMPDVARAMADMGVEVSPQGPDEFKAFIQSEIQRFAAVTKPLGITTN